MKKRQLPGGWIYIMFSSADYSRCKIGKTDGSPIHRFRQLRTGDARLALHVAYYIPEQFGPTRKIESAIHTEFSDYRLNNHEDSSSEWFSIDMDTAEIHVGGMLSEWLDQEISDASQIYSEVLVKMWGSEVMDFYHPAPHDLAFAAWVAGGTAD